MEIDITQAVCILCAIPCKINRIDQNDGEIIMTRGHDIKGLMSIAVVFCVLFSPQSLGHNQLTITGVDPDSYVRSFSEIFCASASTTVVVYTVPSDKTFVLTDIDWESQADGFLRANSQKFRGGGTANFITGLRFPPGTTIDIDCTNSGGGWILISGYVY